MHGTTPTSSSNTSSTGASSKLTRTGILRPRPQQQQQQLPQPSVQPSIQPSVQQYLRLDGSKSGQLLSRPSRNVLSPQQQSAAARKLVLDDHDARLAAYDTLVVQVTCPAGISPPQAAASFNTGGCKVRPVMASAMKGLRVQRPTPLQGHIIPAIREGHDVLASGPPGSGASTAALVGVLSELMSVPRSVPPKKALPLGLLLCPTRELALQLAAQGAKLVAGTHLTVKCVTGGAPITQQVLDLRKGADLLVATPGRLADLLSHKVVSLARLKIMVLEELDELMGPCLLSLTRQLLHHATMPSYQQRQTIALGSSALPQPHLLAAAADVLQPSAVVIRAAWPLPQQQQQQQQMPGLAAAAAPPPAPAPITPVGLAQGVSPLASLLADPTAAINAAVAAAAAAVPPNVTQHFLGVAPQLKLRTVLRLLSNAGAAGGGGLSVVFTNSAAAADEVWAQLTAAGISAGVLHHARSQNQRDEALQCFRFGVIQVLVACGAAYRGLDLPDVGQVVNYEVPLSLAEYGRRLGRAGREGKAGTATTLVTPADGAAVVPLVALLKAGGQPVPEWLGALADGSSSSTSISDQARDAEQPAAGRSSSSSLSAADDGEAFQDGAASPSSSSSSSSVEQNPQQARQQQSPPQQQQQGSTMFKMRPGKALKFGAYVPAASNGPQQAADAVTYPVNNTSQGRSSQQQGQ